MAKIDHESRSTLRKALREKYPLPQYAVLYEVANGMGETFSGYADAIVMGLFPSRGLDMHGIEIKTDRRDWISELRKPRKADRIAKYCDYFWLLTGSEEVAKKEEVPETWGFYTYSSGSLNLVKKPKRLSAVAPDREFIAAMLRRADEMVGRERARIDELMHKDEFARKVMEKAKREAEKEFHQDLAISTREHQKLKDAVEAFEQASGIQIHAWNGQRMGEAVALLANLKGAREFDQMSRMAHDLAEKAEQFRKDVDQFKQFGAAVLEAGKIPS